MKFSGKIHLSFLGFTGVIACGTLLFLLLPFQDVQIIQILRILFSSVFLLFLPGYFLLNLFFHENEIDLFERGSLSVVLSLSMIPLLMFYGNMLGMPITPISVYLLGLGTIIVSYSIRKFLPSSRGIGHSKKIQEK